MSKGKYSPTLTREMIANQDYSFNCYGQKAPEYIHGKMEYDSMIHFDDYDKDGFDRYGYSAFNKNGKFVGHGAGIDRAGYTELDYMMMDDDDYNDRF